MKNNILILLTYLLLCSQTCTQESTTIPNTQQSTIQCDDAALVGHWMMISGTGTFTKENGELVTAPMENYETCKIYWSFLGDNKYIQMDHSTDGDTSSYVGRYEWLQAECKFKMGKWSKKLQDYMYGTATIESIDEKQMKVKVESGPGAVLINFVLDATFKKMPTAFPYEENHCPGFPLIGKWKLTKGTNNNGTSQWSTVEGLAKLGTKSLTYYFQDENNYKILQEVGDAVKVHDCTYEWPGTYNCEKLLLRDSGGKLMEAKVVKLSATKLRIQGKMDGDYIDWTFERKN